MAWTSPKTWVADTVLTAAELNTYVRDNQTILKLVVSDTGALYASQPGPHGIGAAAVDYAQLRLCGSYTSGGGSNVAIGTWMDQYITGYDGDIGYQTVVAMTGSVTTQDNSETIGVVSQLYVKEPEITKGGDTVTLAASIYVANAPTEGDLNYAIYVSSGDVRFNDDLMISAASKLYFDSGNNTYVWEDPADTIQFVCGGTSSFGVFNAGCAIDATQRFYFDGGVNTWIEETTDNSISIFTGGTERLSVSGLAVVIADGDLRIGAGYKIYTDGGDDTYFEEEVANKVSVFCEDQRCMTWGYGYGVVIPTGRNLYFDGVATSGSDTYMVEFGANDLRCVSGGSGGVKLLSGATSWVSASDERLKTIIEPITGATQKVSTLRSVIGRYNTDELDRRRPFLIGQDVQAVLPEATAIDSEGIVNLAYTETIPLLVAAINEQSARIAALEGQA